MWYASASRSEPAFEAEYGEDGRSGSVSRNAPDADRAVDLVGRDVDEPVHAGPPRSLEEGEGALHVRRDERAGVRDRPVHVALGREVDHRVDLLHQFPDEGRVADVAADEEVARVGREVREVRGVARVGQGVQVDDRAVGVARELVAHEVRADEAGAAGDEEAHGLTRA